MSIVSRYRRWYEHERLTTKMMLEMLESVPAENRSDPRFQQAVTYADHIAACRHNWLDLIAGDGKDQVAWFNSKATLEGAKSMFEEVEQRWTSFLDGLTDETIVKDFSFSEGGETYSLNTEDQTFQLVGHAAYHRGQVVILVEQLGGVTKDTDFIYWVTGEIYQQ